jgi:hypothetical protein
MKHCPSCKRTYTDETFTFCLEDGSLLSASYDPETTLVMEEPVPDWVNPTIPIPMTDCNQTVPQRANVGEPIVRNKVSQESSTIRVDDRVVAICINEQYPHCKDAAELYTCTRGVWRLNKERAEKAKYAFAIYRGVIKEVYEIDSWLPATKAFSDFWVERLRSQGRVISPNEHDGRYEFIGKLAPENIRKKYIGHTLPSRSFGNPILYFNC